MDYIKINHMLNSPKPPSRIRIIIHGLENDNNTESELDKSAGISNITPNVCIVALSRLVRICWCCIGSGIIFRMSFEKY